MIRKLKLYSVIGLCFLFLGIACQKQEQRLERKKVRKERTNFAKILDRKSLRVGILNNPVSYFIYKGTPMGFHYELCKAYGEHIAVDLDLIIMKDVDEAFSALEEGKCDLLAMGLSITQERKGQFLFTEPLMRSHPVFVQNRKSKRQYVNDLLDADSLQVVVPPNTTSAMWAASLQENLGLNIDIRLRPDLTQQKLIHLVAEDSIPATIADDIVAQVEKTFYPQLDISVQAGLPHNVAWAMPYKGRILQQNLSSWLEKFKGTRDFRRLYIKYFLNRKSITRNKTGFDNSTKSLSPYDALIKKQAAILGWDWRLFSALVYTESRFDPTQVSWAGAFGLMQLMPITANQFGAHITSPPAEQLVAGRKYLRYLEREMKKSMADTTDLKQFVLAAYNCGPGHVMDARNITEKYSGNKDSWEEVAPFVLRLSEAEYYNDPVVKYGYYRGKETVQHVQRIMDLYRNYQVLLP